MFTIHFSIFCFTRFFSKNKLESDCILETIVYRVTNANLRLTFLLIKLIVMTSSRAYHKEIPPDFGKVWFSRSKLHYYYAWCTMYMNIKKCSMARGKLLLCVVRLDRTWLDWNDGEEGQSWWPSSRSADSTAVGWPLRCMATIPLDDGKL